MPTVFLMPAAARRSLLTVDCFVCVPPSMVQDFRRSMLFRRKQLPDMLQLQSTCWLCRWRTGWLCRWRTGCRSRARKAGRMAAPTACKLPIDAKSTPDAYTSGLLPSTAMRVMVQYRTGPSASHVHLQHHRVCEFPNKLKVLHCLVSIYQSWVNQAPCSANCA